MKANINGTDIHYVVEGKGPWLTLAHPLGADLTVWDGIAQHFAPRYTVLRYDSRGHGGSAVPPGPYTLPTLAADLKTLLAALHVPRTHFAGISMGGAVGQQFALDYPGMLTSMTLIDTTSHYGPEDGANFDERAARALTEGMPALADATLERWLTEAFRRSQPEAAARIHRLLCAASPEGFAASCAALKELDLTERLAQIRCPTLVLVGDADASTPVASAKAIVNQIRGARLGIIAEAAHLSIVDQQAAVIAQVETFMAVYHSNE